MSNWLDLSNNANCFKSMYIDGFLDISGGNIQTRGPNDNLIVQGDVSLNQNLYLDKYLSLGVPKYTNTYNYTVAAAGGVYVFNGGDYTDTNNPVLTFYRGSTYNLTINAGGHPFWIQTTADNGDPYDAVNNYNDGITGAGTDSGVITFIVPYDAPDTLYYRCGAHGGMGNTINIQTFQKYGMDVSGVVDLSGDLYMKSGDISGTNLTVMGDCSVNGIMNGLAAKISDATFNNDVIMQNRLFVNTSDLSYNGIDGYNTTTSINGAYSLGTTIDGTQYRAVQESIVINKNNTHMVVGVNNSSSKGGIQIYERDGNGWVLRKEQFNQTVAGYYGLNDTVAINADATVILVGQRGYNNYAGRIHIYTYDVNDPYTLTEVKYFDGNGGLGTSVAINSAGTMIVAGASVDSKVYTYTYDGANWNNISSLTLTGNTGRNFGAKLRLTPDNSDLVVTELKHNTPGASAGCIRCYSYNSVDPSWNQVGSDITGDNDYDEFGQSLAINDDGTMLAASAHGPNFNTGGYVKVFDRLGNNWVQRGLTISNDDPAEGFGRYVSINSTGSIMAISNLGKNSNYHTVQNDGRLRIYEAVDNSWNLINNFFSADTRLAQAHKIDSTGGLIVATHPMYGSYGRLETYDVSVNIQTVATYASVNDVDTTGNFSTTDISLNASLRVPGNITIVDNSANNYGAYITYAQKSGADYFNMGKSPDNVFNIVNQNNIGIYMPTGSNSFTGTSDERLKKDIEQLENATDKVMQLKPCSYKWKTQTDEDTEKHVGFIAQEVEEVLPEVVNENEYPDGSKYKGVSTTDMIPYLIKMNNELENKLKELGN